MGTGAAGRSRVDLLPGEVIALEVVSPTGPGVTYLWELTDKAGSSATLTSTTAASTQIGSSGAQITELNGFKIKLTANDNGTLSSTERIACVRSSVSGLRPALFAETAPASARLAANDPDLSTDNSQYGDLVGTGEAGQNWRGHAQWQWELLQAVEALVAGGGGGGDGGKELAFNALHEGTSSLAIGAVWLTAGQVLSTDSRALIGTVAGGTATLRLRRHSDAALLTNAVWTVTGVEASVALSASATAPASDWYTLELSGDDVATISVAHGLHLE